ncbi:MAG: ABC transporter ATP-binding protein [Acetomicrobium sp.]
MSELLVLKDVVVSYGAVTALKGVSIKLNHGQIIAVLGANGAGKSTMLKSISKIVPLKEGKIFYKGKDMASLSAHDLAFQGISHVPEGRRVFPTLTVEENLNLGAYGARKRLLDEEVEETKKWIFELFPVLAERKNQLAGTLSGGEQQMLAIGRGLIAKPTLLLLDEPSLGLAPILVKEIFNAIRKIHEESGTSILLVEQNAKKALAESDYAYILETGKISIEGPASELAGDERVKAAYLGGSAVTKKSKNNEERGY